MVKYTYESWRKVLSVTDAQENEITDEYNIGFVNAFRYRGYYYDYQTGYSKYPTDINTPLAPGLERKRKLL